ncbi:zf-HC2 domain-containing protein [Neobacillus drentensis]|uniref:zf-HC2 domain-containing protein n=1 Tax=Neobacillus drentensis TaxID=220684 RepID=UPI002FFDC600
MTNNCEIVRDLLPSYIDKICSKDSSQFIEEHLNTCGSCREILANMKTDVDIPDEIHKNERLKAKKPFKKLSEFFKTQKRFTTYILSAALIALLLGIIFLAHSIMEIKEYKKEVNNLKVVEQEKEVIMNDVFNVLGASNGIAEQEEEQLLHVFDKYQDKLNLMAVFPAKDVENWVEENESVRNEPTTIYPVDYQKAALVIGSEGIIESKEQIIPSGYDLGTVVMANEGWVVQYEYKNSYEKTIEKHHQLKYFGPTIWSFYQLPILFFSIFSVLAVIWLFLKKHNRQLKGVID